jgi:hypothetical protein
VAANNTSGKTETMRVLLGPVGGLLLLFFLAIVVTLAVVGGGAVVPAALGVTLSFVTLGSVVFALRHYTRLWFLCWFIPLVPMFAFLEPIRLGAMSLTTVIFVYSLAYALTFGVIVVARAHFVRWVQ